MKNATKKLLIATIIATIMIVLVAAALTGFVAIIDMMNVITWNDFIAVTLTGVAYTVACGYGLHKVFNVLYEA